MKSLTNEEMLADLKNYLDQIEGRLYTNLKVELKNELKIELKNEILPEIRKEIKVLEEKMNAGFDTLTSAIESIHDVLENHEKRITVLESSTA